MNAQRKRLKFVLAAGLAALALAPLSAGEVFKIDPGHSSILFKVTHFNVSQVYGRFNQFEGSIDYDGQNPSAMKVNLVIKAESVDTAQERRDKHLRSPDFFNANQFGDITFTSTKVESAGEGEYHITGDLTILGVTKSVSAHIKETGSGDHPRGGFLRGFSGTATIKRSDFNMSYGLDSGALSDEVDLIFSFETARQDS